LGGEMLVILGQRSYLAAPQAPPRRYRGDTPPPSDLPHAAPPLSWLDISKLALMHPGDSYARGTT